MEKKPFVKREEISLPEVVEQPVMWGYHRDLNQADSYKAIVDLNTRKLYSIVSQDYRLIRHEMAIDQIEEAISKTPGLGEYDSFTEFYNDGGRMRRVYGFPDIKVEVVPGDHLNPELQLFNSYDLTWPFTVILGAFRLVCSNGLVVLEKFLHLRKRHIVNLDKIELKKQVSTALERFDRQTREWGEWADRRLTIETYARVMEAMKVGKKATEEIDERIDYEAEDFGENDFPIMSLWAFYNILTWFITHRSASLNYRVTLERRLRGAMGHFRGR